MVTGKLRREDDGGKQEFLWGRGGQRSLDTLLFIELVSNK